MSSNSFEIYAFTCILIQEQSYIYFYFLGARELVKPERNTLTVSMKDVERYNPGLAQSIQDEYYRLYPFLCSALKNYVTDRADMNMDKEYFVAFSDVDAQLKVRDLTR